MISLNRFILHIILKPFFEDAGFKVFTESELQKEASKNGLESLSKYVIKNAKYQTIYNEGGKTEFVIVAADRRIRVEAKYQASPGSVDEKYPYMLLNGIYKYPENEIIFVVDGDGYKPGARQWLADSIRDNWLHYKELGKDIKLMSIAEFLNWFNHEFT